MRTIFVTSLLGLYVFAVVLLMSVTLPLDHDEHQFMASAFLVATGALHPYQDFAYFHMPNLVYLYALLLPLSTYPLLMLRLFVGLCTIGIAILVFCLTYRALPSQVPKMRLYVAVSCTLLLVNSPLVTVATAHVWNHTPATLCALLAFLLHTRALQRDKPIAFLWSGFCVGMAIGMRLSFAPMVLPFMLIVFLWPAVDGASKVRRFALFTVGCTIANLPALFFLFTRFNQFWFGNFGYAALNTLYRQQTNFPGAMSLADKLIYLVKGVYSEPGDLLLLLIVLYSLVSSGFTQIRKVAWLQPSFGLLLLILPFLYLGAFAPTPAWYQYFFAPIPFLLLITPYVLAQEQQYEKLQAAICLLLVVALLSVFFGPFAQSPHALFTVARPAAWFPIKFHNTAQELPRALALAGVHSKPSAPILTLAPLYAVESGLPIYPAFATGPFAWRVGPLLSTVERQTQMIIRPDELTTLLQEQPPAAILVTNNPNDRASELPLRHAARQFGYRPQTLSDGSTLWVGKE